MGYIYKITNDVNGKMYIGKTDRDAEIRFKEHLYEAKTSDFVNRPLYAAINKYGEDHFHFEIIEKTINSDVSCEREQYWISKLRTYVGFEDCNGYNATLGGEGTSSYNYKEVIDKYMETNSIKDTMKYFNCSYSLIRNAFKTLHINKVINEFIIYKIDPDTMLVLEAFNCPQDIVDTYKDFNVKTLRTRICEMDMYKGFYWFHKKDYNKSNIIKILKNKMLNVRNTDVKNSKYDYKKICEDILETNSLKQTMINFNYNIQSISMIRYKLYYLYGETLIKSILNDFETPIAKISNNEIVKVYKNIKEASLEFGIDYSHNIAMCCRGIIETAYGYKWERLTWNN